MNEVRRIALQSAIELATKTRCQVFSVEGLLMQAKEIENYLGGYNGTEQEFHTTLDYEVKKAQEDFKKAVLESIETNQI